MRRSPAVAILLLSAVIGFARDGAAQDPPRLTILNVTQDTTGDRLTITGKGFGQTPTVSIDGQPVVVLQGGTDTQVSVLTPLALQTTPGTYRLTVVDPVRQVGDAFVVVSRASPGAPASASGPPAGAAGGAPGSTVPSAGGAAALSSTTSEVATIGILSTENGAPTFSTALGFQALATNANAGGDLGLVNTALGYQALLANVTGDYNTATGGSALLNSQVGSFNTATGAGALLTSLSGSYNSAFGYAAMQNTQSGQSNTAAGVGALFANQTGSVNTAIGQEALRNSTANYNTALGYAAGFNATTGTNNLFLGAEVRGSSTDTDIIRIGATQTQTFIAGIRGTTVTAGLPMVIDANGQVGTAPTTGATFANSGNVGIGTTTPLAKLHINSATNDGARFTDGTTTGIFFPSGILGHSFAIGTQSNHALVFGTNNVFDRLSIAANGNVGIGTTTPVAKLEVRSPTNNGVRFSDGTTVGIFFPSGLLTNSFAIGTQTNHALVFGTNDTWGRLTLLANGRVGVGTMTPTQPLEMASGAYVSAGGVWTNASSRTLKDQIAALPADRALAALAQLQPVTYVYKTDPAEPHVGFIAEDVPDLVATADRKSLAAMDVVAVVTRVTQVQQQQLAEQQAALAAQQATIVDQQGVIEDLKARLARLEAIVTAAAPGEGRVMPAGVKR